MTAKSFRQFGNLPCVLVAFAVLVVLPWASASSEVQRLPLTAAGTSPGTPWLPSPAPRLVSRQADPNASIAPKPLFEAPKAEAPKAEVWEPTAEIWEADPSDVVYSTCPEEGCGPCQETDRWQLLPDGLIYRSYLAGVREPRFGCVLVSEKDHGVFLDTVLGGRVPLLRYGTEDVRSPEGWQLDLEGAAFPRLDRENNQSFLGSDFRIGVPLTYGNGRYQSKLGVYHLCAHLGDKFLLDNPGIRRVSYIHDTLVWGHSFHTTPNLRLYAEVGWSLSSTEVAHGWEFQFGIDYSPHQPFGPRGAPFFAINGHIREAVGFSGNLVVQTGWQLRGDSGHLVRYGLHYFNGKSNFYQFFDHHEEQFGAGIWYDF